MGKLNAGLAAFLAKNKLGKATTKTTVKPKNPGLTMMMRGAGLAPKSKMKVSGKVCPTCGRPM